VLERWPAFCNCTLANDILMSSRATSSTSFTGGVFRANASAPLKQGKRASVGRSAGTMDSLWHPYYITIGGRESFAVQVRFRKMFRDGPVMTPWYQPRAALVPTAPFNRCGGESNDPSSPIRSRQRGARAGLTGFRIRLHLVWISHEMIVESETTR
jgi:hypothetical protein